MSLYIKILLVYPDPRKHGANKDNKIISAYNVAYRPNLTLLTIAALTPKEHSVEIIDDTVDQVNFNGDYNIVGITSMTNCAMRAYELADEFRKQGTKVVLGGWHPSALPVEAKQHSDSVIIGEAEEIWSRVLEDAKNGRIKPFYEQNKPVDLSVIPPIIEERKLCNKKVFVDSVEATRGCTVGCKFCSVTNKPFYRIYRKRPIDTVIEEIRHLPKKFFSFPDASLVLDQKYTKQLFTEMKPLNKKFVCDANIHVLYKDEELLNLLSDAGCIAAFIGLESASQNTLNTMGKSVQKIDYYASIIEKMHDHGISVLGFFMFGLDTDTKDVFDNTLQFILDIDVDLVGCCILTPFPGTPLYDQMEKEGRLLTKDWSQYYESNVVFQPKNMSPEELLDGTLMVEKEFYSSKNILRRMIKSVKLGLFPFGLNLGMNYVYHKWAKQF